MEFRKMVTITLPSTSRRASRDVPPESPGASSLLSRPTLSLSHRVQKTVLYISVSFAVSYTGFSLLSKFHIYVLVYCIDVFLSGLLHSV